MTEVDLLLNAHITIAAVLKRNPVSEKVTWQCPGDKGLPVDLGMSLSTMKSQYVHS